MTKKSIIQLIAIALFLSLPGYAAVKAEISGNTDINGTWKGTTETRGQTMTLGFTFKTDGSSLTGTHTRPRGREFPILDGSLDGNDISFNVHVTGQPDIRISFKGKIIGEEIKLNMQMDMPGMDEPSEVTIKKVKETSQRFDGDSRAVADAAFDELVSRDFASLSGRFSPQMKAAIPSKNLRGIVSPVLNSLGELKSGRPEPVTDSRNDIDVFTYEADFERARMAIVISIDSAGQVGGLFMRPPTPEPPKPGDLAVTSGNFKLPATLVLPEGKGPFPAVVLVHGSGPNDRDETVGANKPFKDLAEGLAKHGVATLRYEKRTRQYPGRGVSTVQDEVIDDALNALILARSRPDIDPERVFLLGHSLGAYLAPRIAEADEKVAGIILLAGNVRPILEIAKDQLEYLNLPQDRIQMLKAGAPESYWDDLNSYDPVVSAQQLRIPILILQGERDYQVTMKEFDLWKSGLKGHENVTFKSYPKLNHLFLEGAEKSFPAEYGMPGHIPDYVFTDIADFVM